tara:strand:+ start:1008 stop:1601 length:594 start_codon:yes stop_codon:yes gene_type:complete
MNSANQKNIAFYKNLIKKHGNNFKSLNWGSEESQKLRFEILCQSINLNNKKILDVGCGLCDFYSYLLKKNINLEYTGIDITDDMIMLSKKKFPNINVLKSDIVQIENQYDCIFASGIFTYQSQGFLEEFVKTAFSKTKEVLAFNVLSNWSSNIEQNEFYADPLETLTYCRTLSPYVTLRHDYHSGDFTIYLYKSKNK